MNIDSFVRQLLWLALCLLLIVMCFAGMVIVNGFLSAI